MPVAKVVTVAACQSIRSRENRSERWLYQPYDVALRGFQQEEVAMEAVQGLNPLAQPGEIITTYVAGFWASGFSSSSSGAAGYRCTASDRSDPNACC